MNPMIRSQHTRDLILELDAEFIAFDNKIFGESYPSSLDEQISAQDWRRYLYFNAGFFFHESPTKFGGRFLEFAQRLTNSTRPRITRQSFEPWLGQVVLPMLFTALGRRHTLARGWSDEKTNCNYRRIPILYALEDDRVITKLERLANQAHIRARRSQHTAVQRMIYQK